MGKLSRFVGFAIPAAAGGWLAIQQQIQEASGGTLDGGKLAARDAKLFAVVVITGPPIAFFLIAVHEAAHGVVGALLGHPPTGFGIGNGELLASRKFGRLTLYRRRHLLRGGYTTFAAEPTRWRGVAIFLAGPLANLAITAAMIAYGSAARAPDVMLATISLGQFVANILPGPGIGIGRGTDGRRVAQLLTYRRRFAQSLATTRRTFNAGFGDDPASAIAIVERTLNSPVATPSAISGALSAYPAFLYVAERYADAWNASIRLAAHRPLSVTQNTLLSDALCAAHVTGQRLADSDDLRRASEVIFGRLREIEQAPNAEAALELGGLEHAAALACLATGSPQRALAYARASLLHVPRSVRALPDAAFADAVAQSAVQRRLARAAEALAAWQCDQSKVAYQILADFRLDDPQGVWTRTLARMMQEPGLQRSLS